ncbi:MULTISPECIES: hypothetical protein [Aminobacter]|uniref:Flagellar assembly protein FliH/Type III secretion system HrpE domain-containing protein n=1 Tax=Aminobacter ciceronei TaxID=150723 RepID=A0ABR6CE37_9HYPH|nr:MULTISPECIES: hypothetical protein [Aminobacter]WMC95801.1 hypothetical protein RAR13_20840 [Aminobacter aminovorans]MBA8909523.1 hypothetical protein [Aminobacter ciceronei]MBA9023294.1 hypothetical protein [Aminobacter ciceronei]MRX35714.1 hypothetical protein [Aminobacter sp. MDW-2]QNH36411.1 hypothetical protein H5P29_11255 [Aminobacter sp. MDW-2]
MSIAALFERLTDFAPLAPNPHPHAGQPETSATEYPKAVPDLDIPAIIAEAVAQAEADLTTRLSEEYEMVLEAERQRHAEEVASLGARFGSEAGEVIAKRIAEMETRIVHLTTDAAARVVATLVSDDIRQRSIDALSSAIIAACADREAVRIKVSGPQFLFDALAAAIGHRIDNVDFIEAVGFDLSVAIDDNLFETRLGEWSSALSETLP